MSSEKNRPRLQMVGGQIKTLREYRKMSQQYLAAKCDKSPTYIGQVERGERNPSLGFLMDVCDALDVVMDISFTPVE